MTEDPWKTPCPRCGHLMASHRPPQTQVVLKYYRDPAVQPYLRDGCDKCPCLITAPESGGYMDEITD